MFIKETAKQIKEIYIRMHEHFGDLKWWPGEGPFEMMIGAVLTQNTSWKNVEKALGNLRKADLLKDPEKLWDTNPERLSALIRPSGFYNIKTERLRALVFHIMERYQGDLGVMLAEETETLRAGLLSVKGLGEESTDSILLYAANKPVFVVDGYTKRVFSRHGIIGDGWRYKEIQDLFMMNLEPNVATYNQYHALIVNTGKEYCRKSPRCGGCPLSGC